MNNSTRTALTVIAFAIGIGSFHLALSDQAAASRQAIPPATSPGPAVRVTGASDELADLVGWTLGRFEEAGLELPPLEIRFHNDLGACRGHMGLFWQDAGVVDICARKFNAAGKKIMLHELAHAWTESRLSNEQREAFLVLRRLDVWSDHDTPWELRGIEHAAEIVMWGLRDRRVPVVRLHDTEPDQLRAAYELLTGMPPVFRDMDPDEQVHLSPEGRR